MIGRLWQTPLSIGPVKDRSVWPKPKCERLVANRVVLTAPTPIVQPELRPVDRESKLVDIGASVRPNAMIRVLQYRVGCSAGFGGEKPIAATEARLLWL